MKNNAIQQQNLYIEQRENNRNGRRFKKVRMAHPFNNTCYFFKSLNKPEEQLSAQNTD